jgi:hypothetical protein
MDEIWHWIGEPTGRVIEVTAAALAILGVIIPCIGVAARHIRALWSVLQHAGATIVRRIDARSALSCARLRLAVLFSAPETLVRLSLKACPNELSSRSAVAKALAFVGETEEAKSVDLSGAAWGIALNNGPEMALRFVEPLKEISSAALIAYDGIREKRDRLADENAIMCWQANTSLTTPLGRIAELLKGERSEVCFLSPFSDVVSYLKNKPVMLSGWVPVRDSGVLRPINKRRLRVLRRIVFRRATCKSLPEIASHLAILACARKRFPNWADRRNEGMKPVG